jgi:hypothetical protein
MADFNQTGLGDWYSELLGAAQQQLVLQPDGSYAPAPQFGGPTSLDAIYGGILPSGPTTRQVSTTPVIRSPRDPVGYGADWNNLNGMVAGAWGGAPPPVQTAGARPAITEGVQPAGTVQMPPGARPANIPMPGNIQPMQTAQAPNPRSRPIFPAWDPFNPNTPKDQSRLPTDMAYLTGPGDQNPALEAIDQLTGSGRSTALPFPLPAYRQPTYVPPVEITVNGGQPNIPTPPGPFRARPQTPYMTSPSYMTTPVAGQGNSITFKKGDTVWDLARDRGMTVNAFADLYGLSNPGKIRAGQTVTMRAPIPRTPPPAMRATTQSTARPKLTADEFLDKYR